MGIAYNTSIVRNGLVLHLDAASAKSYGASGYNYNLVSSFVDYNNNQANYTVLGTSKENQSILIKNTYDSWIGYFPATAASTGQYTLEFTYYSDSGSTVFRVDNDGIMDNTYNNSFTATTTPQKAKITVTHTTTGNMQFYFARTSGNSVYVTNVNFYKSDVWYDMSGKTNNASMYGSVPFVNSSQKYFDFSSTTGANSANASLGFSLASAVNTSTGNYTIDCWIKTNQSVGQETLLSNAGGGDGFRFGIGTNGVYALCGPTYTEGIITWSSTFNSSLWHHVVAVFDRDGSQSSGSPRILLYLDGKFQNYLQLPSSQTAQTTALAGIVRNPCCQIWKGNLSDMKIYNRSLTSNEALYNFSASRSRFGV